MDGYEYPIYTDAYLTGEVAFGPYEFINTAAGDDHEGVVPAAYLRASLAQLPVPDMSATDDEKYHGGSFENEIVALMALALGMRAYAGPISRWFREESDPRGRPWTPRATLNARPILLRRNRFGLVLPNVLGKRQLTNLDLVSRLIDIDPSNAVALVRVARLYQDAVWLAEAQPELAWLLLVSSVETAANNWSPVNDLPTERLRAWRPLLAEAIERCTDDTLLERVANEVAPVTGATSKFVRFLVELAPDPPDKRPPDWAQVPWSKGKRRDLFSLIYEYRSQALHGGKPFPGPMCLPPRSIADTHSERPEGLAHGVGMAVWRSEDVPLLLNTFEFIARQALLNWWRSLLPTE